MYLGLAKIAVIFLLLVITNKPEYMYPFLKIYQSNLPSLSHGLPSFLGSKTAFSTNFGSYVPNSTIRGCMFHFIQARMRRFQKIPDSTSDEVLQVLLSSVYGLPFLPIGDALDPWTELKTRNWILYPPLPSQTISPSSRRPGSSPPPTPSPCGTSLQQSAVEYDEPRTNNASEGGNKALNRAFNASHPSMWTFISTVNTPQVTCNGGDQVSTYVCWHSNF